MERYLCSFPQVLPDFNRYERTSIISSATYCIKATAVPAFLTYSHFLLSTLLQSSSTIKDKSLYYHTYTLARYAVRRLIVVLGGYNHHSRRGRSLKAC